LVPKVKGELWGTVQLEARGGGQGILLRKNCDRLSYDKSEAEKKVRTHRARPNRTKASMKVDEFTDSNRLGVVA